jgi:signal transduction histidine kinase
LIQSFKQISIDQTSSQARSFFLATVVAEMLVALSPSLKKTPFVVQQDIPADLAMDSFPGPLGQVLMNLIDNAVIHGFEGRSSGLITISARAAQPGWVELAVQDDGAGIAPERIKQIFDPFFSTKFGKGGSGLGLSISNNIVTRLLGGQIDVSSTPGTGARFRLMLPLQAGRSDD